MDQESYLRALQHAIEDLDDRIYQIKRENKKMETLLSAIKEQNSHLEDNIEKAKEVGEYLQEEVIEELNQQSYNVGKLIDSIKDINRR